MDASSLTRKFRRQKQNDKEDINCSGRTLSELPDDVLLRIVSLLPTKEAVRTSILSKRWEYIWTSIPKLVFQQGHAETADFINFVERAFLLRGSSDITMFYLNGKVDASCRVEAWISAAVRCNVRECELHLEDFGDDLSLPLSLVNCGTLTRLHLTMMTHMLRLPSPICFSSLTKLDLNFVTFPDEHSTQQLFSGCPVLEDLVLDFCHWVNVTTVTIFSPRLRTLTLNEAGTEISDGYEFIILGSGLEYLYYSGQFHFDLCILNSSFLEKVRIYVDISIWSSSLLDLSSSRRISFRLLRLLKSISHVQNLTLGSDGALVLAAKPEFLDHLPIFTCLLRLELDYKISDLTNVALLKILHNIPCLESLVFEEGINLSSADASEDAILNPVPPCFLYYLDFIYIYIQDGDDRELNVVKVLLRSAVVLTEMAVKFSVNLAGDTKSKFCEELLKLPRGSKDCGIHIHGGFNGV